jgi:tryptophanyl-tRNA synthetase
VPETFELHLYYQMPVSVPRLERVPTLKEMATAAHLEAMPYGLLGQPVLQAADILLPRAPLVPVVRDNQAHVEGTREIALCLKHRHGGTFPIRDLLLGEVPSLLGSIGWRRWATCSTTPSSCRIRPRLLRPRSGAWTPICSE